MSQSHTSERLNGEPNAGFVSSGARFFGAIALSVMAAACASTGAVPRPFPTPGGATASPDRAQAHVDGYAVVGTTLQLRGVTYRDRGADPGGFDCSGFWWAATSSFTRRARRG